MEYDVDFYIKFFSGIPEDKWAEFERVTSDGRRCAHGHCSTSHDNFVSTTTPREKGLCDIAIKHLHRYGIAQINNGCHSDYVQSTPKQRVIAFLNDVKDKELSEANLKATKELINQPSQLQEV